MSDLPDLPFENLPPRKSPKANPRSRGAVPAPSAPQSTELPPTSSDKSAKLDHEAKSPQELGETPESPQQRPATWLRLRARGALDKLVESLLANAAMYLIGVLIAGLGIFYTLGKPPEQPARAPVEQPKVTLPEPNPWQAENLPPDEPEKPDKFQEPRKR